MTGQGKSAIDTLLAESFKELALKTSDREDYDQRDYR